MKKKSIATAIVSILLVFAMSVSVFAANLTAEDIALGATYQVMNAPDGNKTVNIIVDVENTPELADIGVIYTASKLMFEEAKAYDDGTYSLMSLKHIAGELALHVFMFYFTEMAGGADESNSLHTYYEYSRSARLNIDEDRLPEGIIEGVGSFIIILGTLSEMLKA